MDKLVIDFETYYSTEYSLSKMTTVEYIRSPEFQVVGVSVMDASGVTRWFSGTKKATGAWLQQFDWEHSICVAHNAIFDGGILEMVFGIKPHTYFCTMMAGRPWIVPYTERMALAVYARHLGFQQKGVAVQTYKGKRREDFSSQELASYGDYCNNDVDLCAKIATWLWPQFPESELACIDLTIKKYTRPTLLLDKQVCVERHAVVFHEKAQALEESGVELATLMSNAKFAKELGNYGVDIPRKVSPTTGKKTFAFAKTDYEFTRLLHSNTPAVRKLVSARLKVKSTIEETRLQRFIDVASLGNAELNVPILYWGARPGRYSGLDKLNLQNLGRGSELRRAVTAPDGYSILTNDLAQIEARILACLAGQWDLVQQFADGVDVYAKFASRLFSMRITKDDNPDERFIGKQGILSLGYQAGSTRFFEALRSMDHPITQVMANKTVITYRNTYRKIPDLWDTMEEVIHSMITGVKLKVGPVHTSKNTLWLPNGMPIIYPNLVRGADGNVTYQVGNHTKTLYGGKMTENVVQALARIVMSTAELRLAKRGLFAALSVHDELVYVIKNEHIDAVRRATTLAMIAPVEWMPKLPVACEAGVGKTYYDCK